MHILERLTELFPFQYTCSDKLQARIVVFLQLDQCGVEIRLLLNVFHLAQHVECGGARVGVGVAQSGEHRVEHDGIFEKVRRLLISHILSQKYC